MGSCMSVEEKADKERSVAIDKQIEEDSRRFRKECKILLLGASALGCPARR
jgi:guanine nucleotide-binding protein G(i) subunit alpha